MQWTAFSTVALLTLFQPITAAPWPWQWPSQWQPPQWQPPPSCITPEQANLTATRIRDILGLYNTDLGTPVETIEKIFAPNFASTSNSYALLGGRISDFGKFNTTNKEGEIREIEGATPAAAQRGISTIALGAFDCNKIFWFWNLSILGNTTLKYPVHGLHYLVLNDDGQIVELWTETDSLAYAADRGFKIEYPNGTVLPSQDPAA